MPSTSLVRLLIACGSIALSSLARAALSVPPDRPVTTSLEPSVVAAPPIGHVLERVDLTAWLDGYMPYALERGDVAGAVVAVVKDGDLLVAKGYGYADVDRRRPVDAEKTLFRIGSVSKLFAFTAVMQEVEQGKIDLDRNVNDYLDFKIPDRDDGPITMRHLLTHTAGFEEQIKGMLVDRAEDLVPLETYVRRSIPVRIFKVGTTPSYSNYGASLAGYIVQKVSGQAFDDYVDGHLFKPLGMTQSSFRQPLPAPLAADASVAYTIASEPSKPYELIVASPAGSLAASGADVARFMIAHLEGGAYRGARILSPETTKMMHETAATTNHPSLNRMMLGFYEQNYNGHRVISHGGDTEFMHSYLHLLVDDHVGIFVSVNSTGRERAAGAIRSALFEQFLDRYFPRKAPAEGGVDAATAATHAKLVAGYYESSRRSETSFVSIANLLGTMKVEADKEGTISFPRVKGRNGVVRHFREIEPFVWRDTRGGWRAAALVENGHVSRWSVDEAPFLVFEPSPWWRSGAWLPLTAALSAAANLLTALFWPVAAMVRRRRPIAAALVGRQARGQLVGRMAAAVVAGVSAAWLALVVVSDGKFSLLGPPLDPWLLALSAVSVVTYLGGAGAMLWSAHTAWVTKRPWPTRIWTTALALSTLVLLHTASIHRLMSFSTRY